MMSLDDVNESDIGGSSESRKKRYRTKFSAEQKEEMTQFLDKLGWKVVRQREDFVTQFYEDVGMPRNVSRCGCTITRTILQKEFIQVKMEWGCKHLQTRC